MEKVVADYIELGGGSIALYDNEGEYVVPVVASPYWSRLWEASGHSFEGENRAPSAQLGSWRCQEMSWRAAKEAMEAGKALDVSYPGGISFHAVPLYAGRDVIGAISFGYGEGLEGGEAVRAVAATYNLSLRDLGPLVRTAAPLPTWLLVKLRRNLSTLAALIGKVVEARLVERGTRERAEALSAVVEFVPDALVLVRPSGTMIAANVQAETLFGYSRAELVGQPVELLLPKKLLGRYRRRRASSGAGSEPLLVELKARRKDGVAMPVEVTLCPIAAGDEFFVVIAIRDASERVRSRQALEESERAFRTIYEKGLDAIAVNFIGDGRFRRVNPRWEQMTGFTSGEVLGKTPGEIGLFADKETYRRILSVLEAEERILSHDAELRRKSGETYWVSFSAVRTELDGAGCVLSFALDVTEQKRAREALASYAAELEVWKKMHDAVVHASGQVLYRWTPASNEIRWEGEFQKCLGYADLPSQLDEALALVHPDDRNAFEAEIDRVVRTRAPFYLCYRLRHADGSYRYIEDRGCFVEERPGVDTLVGFLIDATDRRATEEAERRSTERFHDLFNGLPLGLYRTTPDGGIEDANPAFLRMFGCSGSEDLPGSIAELYADPGRRDDVRSLLHSHGTVRGLEVDLRRRDGSVFPASLSARVVRAPSGEALRYEGIVEDISRRKAMEAELVKVRDAALASDRLKDAFLANMSHEVRTPLNVISGFASLIEEHLEEIGDLSQAELFEGLRRSSKRLIDTIHGLLDLSRVETAALEAKPERVVLPSFLQERLDLFTVAARRKGLWLELYVEEGESEVTFDAYCLGRIVDNLLDNAVKFTERGGVTVRVHRDEQGVLCLTVVDTGVGIGAGYLPRLFERFSQEENGYTRRFEGSGIGLALVKRFAELNDASVSCRSEKGEGAAFTLRFGPRIEDQGPLSPSP